MWWLKNFSALALLVLTLNGCGFHPLYGKSGVDPNIADELAAIQIDPLRDRQGQLIHTALLKALTPDGTPAKPRYHLLVAYSITEAQQALQTNASATRDILYYSVLYRLYEGAVAVTAGTFPQTFSYDFLQEHYSNVSAQDDIQRRAASSICDEVRNRLAIYFTTAAKKRAATAAENADKQKAEFPEPFRPEVKLPGNRVEAFLKSPDKPAVLLFGPDAGLVKERLDRLTGAVLTDLKDPFRLTDLSMAMIKDDPARLSDEFAALSMTGGRRVVRVRDASDSLTASLQNWLNNPVGEALLLIEAGELSPRSSLRKLAESSEAIAALACYADEAGGLAGVINESLRAQGLSADQDAITWLADHLGNDRLATRSEIAKLALYMGEQKRVTLADAAAITGDSAALSQDDLAMATAEGDQSTAGRVLDRLLGEAVSPITILRGLQRHFARLHQAAGLMQDGKNAEQAIAALRPPPHFRVAGRMKNQITRWNPDKLATALDLLLNAELDCKSSGLPAPELCGRAVLQLARAAGRR